MRPDHLKVVVAEDSPANRRILVHLLERCRFQVIECEDGRAALEILNKLPPDEPHLILSDLMMPRLDGLGLLKVIRESKPRSKTPFVLMSSVTDKEQIELAKKLGVDGYILKPITFSRVTQKLEQLFPGIQLPRAAS